MKKLQLHRIFSFLLACAMVLSLVQPLGAWAISEDTVYIDPTNGADTNAGTEAAPVKTLASAYGKLTQGGKIVFLDDLSITGNTYFPVCAYPVTLTSKTGSEGIVTTGTLRMQGETTFENITVTFNAASLAFISGEGYDLTIGENVTTVNKTGNQVNLVATKRFDATLSASPTLTVKSGTWDYIYATHGNSITGNVTVKMEGGNCRAASPSYNATVTGNVNISIAGGTVSELYLKPSHKNGNITGSLNISLGNGASIGKSYAGSGAVQGGTVVELLGNVEKIGTLTGYGAGSSLVLQSGTWKGTAEEFGNVSVDIGAEETLTLSSPITADTVVSAGTLNFDGVGSLTAKTVTGTVNCTITGRVLKNNLYASVPADADLRFPEAYGITNNDGEYLIYDLVDFEGLVIRADKQTTITLYSNPIQGNDPYYGRAEYTVTPYATETTGDYALYYYPNITGNYCYEAVKTDCYTIFQQVYMSEEEAAAYTLEQVVMEPLDGEWDHSYYYGLTDELLYATEGDPDQKWKTEVTLATPVFTNTDKAAQQMTTQPELEAFIASLDDAKDNMYIYSIGTSSKYGFNVPIVIFTKTDLSQATTLEAAAALMKADGKPNMAYKAHTHGDEPAGGEGALAVIDALDKADNQYLLDSINIYVIPRINPDGAYDSKRNLTVMLDPSYENRDPDRDLLDMNSKEMRQYMYVTDLFQPVMELDGHERQRGSSDGDIQLGIAWKPINGQDLFDVQLEMLKNTCAELEAMDLSGAWYSGQVNASSARNNRGYATHQGRIQILMETRGIYLGNEAYAHRTACHVVSAMSFLKYAAENATTLASVVEGERQRIINEGAVYDAEDFIILSTGATKHPELALETERYDLLSGEMTVIRQVPEMHDQILRSRVAPTAYVLPADLPKIDAILDQMDAQSIAYTKLPANAAVALQQYYGTTDEAFLTEEKTVLFPNGAYVFTMNQAKGEILALLMEPDVTDLALYKNTLTFQGKIPQDTDGYFSSYRYIHDLQNGQIAYTVNPVTAITTIYVSASGNDSNAGTEAAPVKTLAGAYSKLTQSGKIVFLDDLSLTGNTVFPTCSYPVTLTSKTGSEGIITTGTLRMQGNTTFENITVTFNASGLAFISGEGYDLTIGENVTTVNKTGNQVNLVATKRFDATLSANPTLTVKSGKWDYIYATHGNSITGDVTVNIEGGTCTSVSPSYNATVTGNVNISIKNATVSKLYLEPTHKNGNITGAYTVTLGDGANVKASSGDAGVTQNGTTVKVVGNVDSIGTLTGYGEGSNLVLRSGTWKGTAEEFGNVSVDIGAEETLTLSSPITADTVVSAGTLNFDGVGSLIAQTVTGTVNCTITGRVLKNNLYASVPADADLRFPASYGLVNNNGQYMIYDLVNFEGLVVKADEAVKIIFYNDALNNNTTYHGRKDYVIEPYATTEENGVVSYYLPNITGLYCYEASQTGYYTIFQQVYMTEAEAATCTVEEVVMEKRSGEWDLSYYYGQPQEILDAMEPATDKWQTEVPLETPVFTRTDKGAHQMTTQPELEAFIENLDDADDNMYIFSIGKSATYDFDMPIVIFTKADLSAAKTLEQAAELLKQSGIPNVGYKAQMHGDEHAAGEGALGVIKLLDKEENKYLLDSINIFVIPRINPDGGYKDQRNMITRIDETINNYDPNRDMLSLNLQEQRNYLRAIQLLDPIAELDGHERQRNSFVGDIQISMSWQAGTSQALFDLQAEMLQSIFAALEAVDLSGAWYNDYMNTDGVDQTRGYAGSQGRIQFLMETRGIYMGNEAYRSRTASHIVTAMEYLRLCAENATEIQSVVSAAQQSIVTAGETYEDTDTITLAWEGTAKPEFDILTDHYSLEGGEVQTQKAKLYTAKTTRVAPTAYVIPANLEKINLILELMDLQEISYYFLPANTAISLQQYSGTVDENRITTNVALTEEQSVVFASGAYVFQMNQVNARNLALLMEPDSPSQSDLVQLGRITVGSDGSFPIYRYIHDLKDGKIEYDANGASTLTTVYVSASGSDSNTGAENAPVATLERAYELLIGALGGSKNLTGTIILADDYTITASARVDLPAHTFPVKIMGKTAAVKLIFKPTELGESLQQLAFHGPTTLDDLEFRGASTGKLDYIYACGNPFTVGANVTTSAQSSLPILVAGDYRTAAVDTQMTVLGGTWYGVYAGSFRAGHTGTAKLTVNGAKINNFIRGKYAETTSGNFVLDLQNTSFTKFNPGYTGAVSGTITVILREGAEGTIYTNNQSSGNITGTYTVVAAGADLSKVVFENTSDTVTKDVLVFTGGEIAPVAGFSEIHIDTENTVTLTADMTVDQISGGGTVELNGYSLTGDGAYGMDAAVKSVALRPSAAGLYYTGEFKVSEALSGATCGIALSTEDATPVAEDGTTSLYTVGATSVLVKDIMKVGNAENRKNATVRIYARAYIKLEDGTTIYGDTVKVTLRQLVTAIDTKWDGLTELQKTELKAMYATFASDMGHWNIPNLKSAV